MTEGCRVKDTEKQSGDRTEESYTRPREDSLLTQIQLILAAVQGPPLSSLKKVIQSMVIFFLTKENTNADNGEL